RNIAFGIPDDEIDLDRVRRSAATAGIDEFISGKLREGYQTRIGERGVRLSGGQLQRIGLARALYGEPSVLFLDEATSALDSRTEDLVMKGIRETAEGRTVVMIAHRLSTVRFCDRIAVMEDGRLVDVGTWEELVDRSELFRNLVGKQQEETQ
ncbi:MAG: ATP-binding cassette domain-containing protein, partial [Planctomycetota bacterium]|nr:ATP-binding cassette domain-containing protein [Planctomycetota bacterium]